MAFTRTWDGAYEALPPTSEAISNGAVRIENLKVDIRERMAIAHYWSGNAFDGIPKSLSVQGSLAGNGNGADITEDVLWTYTLPANSLQDNGLSLRVRAYGTAISNASAKFAGIYFGTDGITFSVNNEFWMAEVEFIRVDATHVITSGIVAHGSTFAIVGGPATVADLGVNTTVIKTTGQSASGIALDVVSYGMIVGNVRG